MGMPSDNATTATTAITNDYGIDARRYSDSSTESDVPEMVRFEEEKGATVRRLKSYMSWV
jgi:hypothetical protein